MLLNSDQLEKLLKYKSYINQIGFFIPNTVERLNQQLLGVKHRFILHLLFATEIIKEELKALLIIKDYLSELRAIIQNKDYSVNEMRDYSTKTYGEMKKFVTLSYDLEIKNKVLVERTKQLNPMLLS